MTDDQGLRKANWRSIFSIGSNKCHLKTNSFYLKDIGLKTELDRHWQVPARLYHTTTCLPDQWYLRLKSCAPRPSVANVCKRMQA
jgi:hypothetical protein